MTKDNSSLQDKPDKEVQDSNNSWRPDYEIARKKAGFSWRVSASVGAFRALTEVPIKDFNLKPEACIKVYREGRKLFREKFDDSEISLPGVATPPISYGHVNCLGAELLFPEGGEVNFTHLYDSVEEGIEALKQPVDFEKSGMAPYYLEFREKLQEAFPGEDIGFGFGAEGPITTAYEALGESFYLDLFDTPRLTQEFLQLLTESINDFHRFTCKVRGVPVINPDGGGMCDDLASLIPPGMWDQFVLPYWDQFYRGQTTGKRHAHVENLKPAQLKYLEQIGLTSYDPSISHDINPEIIASECRVPFGWRMGSFHCKNMNCQEIKDFVYKAVADGASSVHTIVSEIMINEEMKEKVYAFMEAARKAKQLLEEGADREEIGELVSSAGQKKFWDKWPE